MLPGSADYGKGKIYITKFGTNDTYDVSPDISVNTTGSLIREMENVSLQWC